MKLNLLPTTVSTANRGRNAIIGSVLLVLLAGGATAYMAVASSQYLQRQKEYEQNVVADAQNAVTVAKRGDAATADPNVVMLVKNVALARAMTAHSDKYPKLYDDIRPYIPSFFRLTALSAAPLAGGAAPTTGAPPALGTTPGATPAPAGGTSVVNMQGVIRTYQEYADLMLALLRIPGSQSVSRAGFAGVEPEVPAITEADQNARPRLPGEEPVPDDPLDRLAYFTDQPKEEGYVNSGNFGSGAPGLRTITPNASLIDVRVVVARDLQTPDPRATLGTIGAAGATTGATGTPGGGIPGGGSTVSTTTPSVTGAARNAAGAASGRATSGDDD